MVGDGSHRLNVRRPHECVAIIRDQTDDSNSRGVVCRLQCHFGELSSPYITILMGLQPMG